MSRLLRLPLACLLALAACDPHVSGDGVLGEETRNVAPFDEVEASLAFDATVTANADAQQVTVSGDENLLQYVLTPVEGTALKVRLNGIHGIDSVHPLRLIARARSLHAVRVSEAATMDVKGAGDAAPGFTFEVTGTGAGRVQLQGPGGARLVVTLSGASALDAWSYPVAGANVAISGGSTLRVNAAEVAGTASEGSHVELTGGGSCSDLVLSGGSTCR
jgi:hypothetical protein